MSESLADPSDDLLEGYVERKAAGKSVKRTDRTLRRWEQQGLKVHRRGTLRFYSIEEFRAFVLGERPAPPPPKPGRPRTTA